MIMRNLSVKKLTFTGLMAALICVLTMFPHIPIPAGSGYIHLGDGMIFLAAMLLGPQAVAAAALGSALSDLVGGYMAYLLPTAIIKGAMALIAWKCCRREHWLQTLVAFILAELAMVAGYFLFEAVMYGVPAAIGAVGPNMIQGLGGVVVGMLCRLVVPRLEKVMK